MAITHVSQLQVGANNSGSYPITALLAGGGTSAVPETTATAGKNFVGYYTKSTATTGDSRGTYLKHKLDGTSGVGNYGDTLRAYTVVGGTGYASATGMHATCEVAAAGSITGLGVGLRASLSVKSTVTQGTLAGLLVDIQNTVAVTATEMSCLRISDSSAGGASGTKAPYFAILDGVDTSALFVNNTVGAASKGLKIKVNGTDYYILLNSATS
jgi:hypothetical protein